MTAEGKSEGSWSGDWPGGWLVAVVAGVIAAILARWLGDVGMVAAVLVGIFVFLVFGVVLGSFWTQGAAPDHGGQHEAPAPAHGGHGAVGQNPAPVAPTAAVLMASEPPPAPEPVVVEAGAPAPDGVRPSGLAGPRHGGADKLQTIEGIGPALEKLCHDMGVFHFDQIAGWGEAEVAWMDGNLKGFKGRVSRDKWVRQARLIGEVGMAEFLRRAKTNDY